MLSDIFSNHLLMNALLAWATAQLLKFFIYLAVNRTIDWKRLTGDGGMPSGHSATVTALAVTSGLEYGYDSPVFAVCVILAIIVCTVLGIVIERLAYKPLRAAPILAVLITAIGVSYFLQNAALLLWSSNPKVFTSVIPKGNISLFDGQLTIPYVTLVTIVVCIIIMIALVWFTSKTKMGKAMRACSEDKGAAQLMGINVNGTISLTFAIGSGLAAIAGVLLCSAYPTLVPTTGSMPGIKAFTAAVFGGIGSIPGALLGGVLLGIIEIFAKAYISTQLSDAIVFAVLIVVLIVRPAGLLGKQVREKV